MEVSAVFLLPYGLSGGRDGSLLYHGGSGRGEDTPVFCYTVASLSGVYYLSPLLQHLPSSASSSATRDFRSTFFSKMTAGNKNGEEEKRSATSGFKAQASVFNVRGQACLCAEASGSMKGSGIGVTSGICCTSHLPICVRRCPSVHSHLETASILLRANAHLSRTCKSVYTLHLFKSTRGSTLRSPWLEKGVRLYYRGELMYPTNHSGGK